MAVGHHWPDEAQSYSVGGGNGEKDILKHRQAEKEIGDLEGPRYSQARSNVGGKPGDVAVEQRYGPD
jgi:hypothetical protein